MLTPFYLINPDWALFKGVLAYRELPTCHKMVSIPLEWVALC